MVDKKVAYIFKEELPDRLVIIVDNFVGVTFKNGVTINGINALSFWLSQIRLIT